MLDFSQVDDNQLMQLIQAVMQEAVKRGSTVERFMRDCQIDAAEEYEIRKKAASAAAFEAEQRKRQQIAEDAAQEVQRQRQIEETEKAQRLWGLRSAAILALHEDELFRDDKNFAINIWSRGTDRRVYIQEANVRRGWEVVYYETGNQTHHPKKLTGINEADMPRMIRFCQLLCDSWTGDMKITLSEAKNIEPDAQKLAEYKQALQEVENV